MARLIPTGHNLNLMELELRHLKVVCRLADTGSISKAAAACGVSQPALTAQLHRIEDAIGGPLFERGPSGVRATPLGRHVLGRARILLADMDELIGGSRRYAAGPRPLRLGSVRMVMFGSWLARLEELLPDREIITQVDASWVALNELLAVEVVDVVMLGRGDTGHAAPCPTGVVEQTMVYPEPAAIALPTAHRLAGQDEINLAELADDIWITPPAGKEDGDVADLRRACEAAGFEPEFRYGNLDSVEIEQLIGAGRGVCLCAPTSRPIPNAVILPLTGQPVLWRRALRWRPERISQTDADLIHEAFVATYRETIAAHAAVRPWWADHPDAHPVVLDPR